VDVQKRTGSILEPTPGCRRRVAGSPHPARVRGPRRADRYNSRTTTTTLFFLHSADFFIFSVVAPVSKQVGRGICRCTASGCGGKSIADTMERSSGTGAPTVQPCRATGHARPSVRTCGWTHVSHQASLSRWSVHAFTGGSGRISAGVGGT
jgi:hypothetical protein